MQLYNLYILFFKYYGVITARWTDTDRVNSMHAQTRMQIQPWSENLKSRDHDRHIDEE
jgi:hypothetical protein